MEDTVYEIVKLDNNIPASVRLITRRSFRNVESHWHQSLEIDFYMEGRIDYIIDGQRKSLGPGDICLINCEAVHRSEVVQDFEVKDDQVIGIILLIEYDFLKGLIPDIAESFFDVDTKEAENALHDQMTELMQARVDTSQGFNNIRMLGIICDILLTLCTQCRRHRNGMQLRRQRDLERLRRILTYLHEHYAENLVQASLAGQFYLSREYFSRFFKKYTGISFKGYLTEYRLMKAADQLCSTEHTVLQIALDNGFSDERRLISNFKKYYGVTPGQYRKEQYKYIDRT